MTTNNASPSSTIVVTEPSQVVERLDTTLHLRGSQEPEESRTRAARVRWEEGTVDNEFMDKKKSKVCCIFHPQRNFDEEEDCNCDSDSSSSSSSSSSSGSESENNKNKDRKKKKKNTLKKLPSPNSYEIQPDYTKKKQHKHNHDHHDSHDKNENSPKQ